MTREDIIRMAEECGIPEFENNESQADNILRFAALVAAAEREACAKVCDDAAFDWSIHASGGPVAHYNHCATAIRARGKE